MTHNIRGHKSNNSTHRTILTMTTIIKGNKQVKLRELKNNGWRAGLYKITIIEIHE